MKFFLDNNLAMGLAEGMRAFGEDVMHLRDKFQEDTPDTEWLEYVGKNRIFLITRDEKIRKNPAELQAIRLYRVGAFFLGGKNLRRCDLIEQLVRSWRRIKETAASKPRPFAFRVRRRGTKLVPINLGK